MVNRHDDMLPVGKVVRVRLAHYGEDIRAHQRLRHDDAQLLAVEAAEVCREHAVNLTVPQSLHCGLHRRIGLGFKCEVCVGQAILRVGQVVLYGACQFTRFPIRGAERQVVVLITDPDSAMRGEPTHFIRGEKRVRTNGFDVPIKHLLVVIEILLLDPAHGAVQVSQKIRPFHTDRKVIIRCADLEYRGGPLWIGEGIHRDIGVQLAGLEHIQRFVLRGIHLDELGVDPVSLRPVEVELRLYAVLVYADPFSVEGRAVGRGYLPVIRRDEKIIFLDAHGIVREQHGL